MFRIIQRLFDNSINIVDVNLTTKIIKENDSYFLIYFNDYKEIKEEILYDNTDITVLDSYFKKRKLKYLLNYKCKENNLYIVLNYNSNNVFYNVNDEKKIQVLQEELIKCMN